MGSAGPRGKMNEKLKKRKHAKTAVLCIYVTF